MLPQAAYFEGIKAEARVSQEASFKEMISTVTLPQPVKFETLTGEANIKVAFPSNGPITPVQGLGMPLGAEKSFLEPRIKDKKQEKQQRR